MFKDKWATICMMQMGLKSSSQSARSHSRVQNTAEALETVKEAKRRVKALAVVESAAPSADTDAAAVPVGRLSLESEEGA
jgi:hypothetical protein